MAYQRGSEEAYRGSPNFNGVLKDYDPETLQLMREAAARNIQQRGQIGDLNAQAIREPGEINAKTIVSLPGAVMQGAEFKRAGEKHQQGSEEHLSNMATAEQARAANASTMEEVEHQKTLHRKVNPKYGMSSEEALQEAGVEGAGLGNKATKAQIAASNMTTQGLKTAAEKQQIEDQATVAAYYQQKGLNPPAPGTPEFKQALIASGAAGKVTAATGAKDTIYDSSPQGVRVQSDIGEVSGKLKHLGTLLAATKQYEAAAPYSKESEDAKIAIHNSLPPLGRTPSQVEGGSLVQLAGLGGDLGGLKTTSGKYKMAANSIKEEIRREINILKDRTKAGASQRVTSDIANLEQTLADIERQSATKPNILGGGGAPTRITNFMQNGANPQVPPGQPAMPMQASLPQDFSMAPGAQLPARNPTSAYRGYAK